MAIYGFTGIVGSSCIHKRSYPQAELNPETCELAPQSLQEILQPAAHCLKLSNSCDGLHPTSVLVVAKRNVEAMASNLVAYKCQKHTTRPGMDLTLSICTWHMLLMPLLAHLAQSSAWLCFRHVKGCNEDIVLCFFVQFLNSTASWITTNGGAHFCVHQLAHVVPGLGAKGNGTILIANKGVAQDDL